MAANIPTIVRVENGTVFANSRQITEVFGKQHRHVLRDINSLLPNLGHQEQGWFHLVDQQIKVGFG